MADEHLEALGDALRVGGDVLVVTGAGVSVASGIPTFRGEDPDAVWARDVEEMGTLRTFRRDPVGSWRWYLSRFASVLEAEPNPAHHALVSLERGLVAQGRGFLLVTQNVDGLHRKAGSERLVEVHGRADRVRCAREGCEHGAPRGSLPVDAAGIAAFLAAPSMATLPTCPACGEWLRPHVLWFDEVYTGHRDYGFDSVGRAVKEARTVLFAGTSFAVGVTDRILDHALRRGRAVFSLDPTERAPDRQVRHISGRAELALPELVAALGFASR